MAERKKKEVKEQRPASTPEAREIQLVNLAVNLAEKQLREGTASSSVITHFLKLATTREQLERAKIEKESKLLDAKVQNISQAQEQELLAKAAIEAMKNYNSGS